MVWLSLPLGEEGGKEKNGAQSLPIFQRVPSGGPDSPAEQEAQHRRQDRLRLTGQFGRGRAGHGVRDQREGVVVGAMRLRSGPAVGDEEIGADHRGRDTALLQEDAVEHTAR